MIQLPEDFVKQMKILLGSEYTEFEASYSLPTPVSIRLNPLKYEADGEVIPWCESGRYLPERPVFTLDPSFHAGAYYVQEASSMLVGYALSKVANVSKPLIVLDLCAAPGGKTTHLTSILHPDSVVVANEVIKGRVNILKENIQKWGYPNVYVSNHDPKDFEALHDFFDVVLVDAPCSGEGLFRKDPAACNEWSSASITTCVFRQQRILATTAELVKVDGILIYSTCTFNHQENQDNALWLINNFQFEEIKLDFPSDWGIIEKEHGYQCFPHKVRGEGFYLSVFRKKSGPVFTFKSFDFKSFKKLPFILLPEIKKWVKTPEQFCYFIKPNNDVIAILESQIDEAKILDKTLFTKGLGFEVGIIKGKDFIPSHGLALSTSLGTNTSIVELSKENALRFLKREHFELDAEKGWVLIQYKGLGLGWVKNLGSRFNNYLPNEWRIRMAIE